MIDTIIFDLDGVIIDTELLWDTSNRLFLEGHGATYNRAAIKPLIAGKSLAEGTRIMQEAYGLSGELDLLVSQRWTTIEQQFRAGPALLPGFLKFHVAIRGSLKTCVATSLDTRLLELVDQQLGLSAMFSGNLFSIADVGNVSKPDPALFLYAAQRMGTSPVNCVVIEDSPNGIQAARNAGMRCIALVSTFDAVLLIGADKIARSFAEIDPTLLSWTGMK